MDIIAFLLALKKAKAYTDSVALGQGAVQIPGPPGVDGRNVEMQNDGIHISWRVVGTENWNNLVALSALKGTDGNNGSDGADGREIELRMAGTNLELRYAGETDWTLLYDFSGIEIPAAILDFVPGAGYRKGETFTSPDTGFIYRAREDFEADSIEAALAASYIRQIGGGEGGAGAAAIPDWAKMSDPVPIETIEESAGLFVGEWTATEDGSVYIEAGANSVDAGWIRLNGWIAGARVIWDKGSSAQSTGNRLAVSAWRPVGDGDTVRVKLRFAEGRVENEYVAIRFIPNRDIVLGTGKRGPRGADGKDGTSVDIQEVVAAVLKALPPGLAVMNDKGELLTLTTIGELNLGDE